MIRLSGFSNFSNSFIFGTFMGPFESCTSFWSSGFTDLLQKVAKHKISQAVGIFLRTLADNCTNDTDITLGYFQDSFKKLHIYFQFENFQLCKFISFRASFAK